MLDIIEPNLLDTVRKGGEARIKLADFFEHLLDEASREVDEIDDEVSAKATV